MTGCIKNTQDELKGFINNYNNYDYDSVKMDFLKGGSIEKSYAKLESPNRVKLEIYTKFTNNNKNLVKVFDTYPPYYAELLKKNENLRSFIKNGIEFNFVFLDKEEVVLTNIVISKDNIDELLKEVPKKSFYSARDVINLNEFNKILNLDYELDSTVVDVNICKYKCKTDNRKFIVNILGEYKRNVSDLEAEYELEKNSIIQTNDVKFVPYLKGGKYSYYTIGYFDRGEDKVFFHCRKGDFVFSMNFIGIPPSNIIKKLDNFHELIAKTFTDEIVE